MPAIMLERENPNRKATRYGKQQQHGVDMVGDAHEKSCIAGKQATDGGHGLEDARGVMGRLIGFDRADI